MVCIKIRILKTHILGATNRPLGAQTHTNTRIGATNRPIGATNTPIGATNTNTRIGGTNTNTQIGGTNTPIGASACASSNADYVFPMHIR